MRGWPKQASLAAGLLAFACHRPPAGSGDPEAPGQELASEDGLEVAQRPAEPPLPVKEALDLIPNDALVVVHSSNVRRLMAGLGRDRFAGDQPDAYDKITDEFVREFGIDPFDPGQLSQIGIDADGPAGFALLDVNSESFMAYFRLRDAPTLQRWVKSKAGADRIDVSSYSKATILRARDNDELALVLRERFGAVVFTDRPERARRDYALATAEADARRSINHDRDFAPLFAELGPDADLMLLVDPLAVMDSLAREQDQHLGAAALPPPPAGATQAELDDWARQQEEMERYEVAARSRRDREREAWRTSFGEFTAVGGILRFSSGRIEGKGVAAVQPDSPWRKLLRPTTRPSVLKALTQKPLLMIGGNLDAPLAVQALDRLAALDGASPDDVRKEFRSEFGIGLDEVSNALRGDFGLAVTQGRLPKQVTRKSMDNSYGLHFVAGLHEPDAARQLLDLFAQHNKPDFSKDTKHDRYVLDPGGFKNVYWAVVGSELVVTTDGASIARIRGKKAADLSKLVPDAELRAVVERPAMGTSYLDFALPVLQTVYIPYGPHAVVPVAVHESLSEAELAKVPKSKKYRAKHKEYERVLGRLEKAQAKRAKRELADAQGVARELGRAAASARVTELGFIGELTWKLGVDDLAALVDSMVRRDERRYATDTEEMDLSEQRWQLESELQELRAREIEAYLGSRR